jgi:kynurenine formamidase
MDLSELRPREGTTELVKEVGKQLSNWGRWGENDQLGTLNYITPEKVARSCGLARTGKRFALTIPLSANGPMSGRGRSNPQRYSMVSGADDIAGNTRLIKGSLKAADDVVFMPLQAATQWDALSHGWYDQIAYNNQSVRKINSLGAGVLGIEHAAYTTIVSRGVLIDLARSKGFNEEKTPEGFIASVEDIEEALEKQGVSVEEGDILMIRSGWMSGFYHRAEKRRRWDGYLGSGGDPGLSWTITPWLHEKKIAALAVDTGGVEKSDELEEEPYPLHMICLRDMGLMLGEMWYLEELAEDCAADGVYEMLLVAPPLPFERSFGSPVNPVAIK